MKIDLKKLLAFAQAHPQTVVAVIGAVSTAVAQQPAIIADAIAAVQAKSPLPFLAKHPAAVGQVLSAVAGSPVALGDLLGVVQP